MEQPYRANALIVNIVGMLPGASAEYTSLSLNVQHFIITGYIFDTALPTINHNAHHQPQGVRRTPILRNPVRCSEAEACGVKKQHMMGVPKGTPSEAGYGRRNREFDVFSPWASGRTPILSNPVRCSEAEACGVKKQHMMGVPIGTPSESPRDKYKI